MVFSYLNITYHCICLFPTIGLQTPPNVTAVPTFINIHGVTPETLFAVGIPAVVFCCSETAVDHINFWIGAACMRSLGVPALTLLAIGGSVPCTKVAIVV